jgi:transcriptional regulator with XRE-family HTH domain
MEVYEKINLIIQEKGLTKREFAKRLIALEPKSNRTGEVMSEKTVYAYLNGKATINANLIPYIAEALDIAEQELFVDTKRNRIRYLKYILKDPSNEEISVIKSHLKKDNLQKIEKELIELLPYIPKIMLEELILKAKQIQTITNEHINQL